jgi:hypothetical protein
LKNRFYSKPKKEGGNKKQEVIQKEFVQKAYEAVNESKLINTSFLQLIKNLERHHFVIHPIEIPPPLQPPMPPFIPSTKLLRAQQDLYSEKVAISSSF